MEMEKRGEKEGKGKRPLSWTDNKLHWSQLYFSTVFKCIGILKRTQIQASRPCEGGRGRENGENQ